MANVKKQIGFGAVISYLGLAINIVVSLIYIPWMVETIGNSNYALYTLAISFINLFLIDFGLCAAVTRFVAKYRAEGKADKINEFIVTIEKLYMIIAAAIFAVLFVLYFFVDKIYKGLTPSEIETFKVLYIIVGTYSVVSFPFLPLNGLLEAYERFIESKLCNLFHKIFSVLLVVCLLYLRADVKLLVTANAVGGILTILLKLIVLRRGTEIKLKKCKTDFSFLKEIASFSIWTMVMGLAQRCIFNIAPTVLGIVSNSDEIALFAPASALEGYFYTFSAAVNGLFLATVSRYVAESKEDRISLLMIKVGRYQFAVLGMIFVCFLVAGKDFMVLWMGEHYEKAALYALLLFVPDILIFSEEIANTAVIAKNKVKEQAIGYIGMAVVCLSLSFLLCGKLGALGSAIAIAASYFFLFVYMNVIYKKHLGLNIGEFFKKCYLSLIIPMVLSGLVGYFVSERFITIGGIWGFALKLLFTGIIYIIFIIPAINSEEKALVKKLFSKFKEH